MSVYLHDIPLGEAIESFNSALQESGLMKVLGRETLPMNENLLGRVLAEPIWAKISSPHYHSSAMDGFAVKAEETSNAQPSKPITFSTGETKNYSTVYVDTGDPLPSEFDAVIPVENVESLDAEGNISSNFRNPCQIRIRASVTPWSNVRLMGEDIIASQLILGAGQVLRPVDLGVIAAAGNPTIKVARQPKVAILPTGTELVPLGTELKPGEILEFNSLILSSQVNSWGGKATVFPITMDDFDKISARVEKAAQDHDLILLNAGSSAGAEDFSSKVVEKLGKLIVHGVAVRPGHPVIMGLIDLPNRHVPIIGVPGFPVSAALTGEIFIEPLIARWTGRIPAEPNAITAKMTRKITSPSGDDDYVRVAVGKVGNQFLATSLPRGAGVITSLSRADGVVIVPQGVQGLEAGEEVQVNLYRSRAEIERTILCVGSHDMTLDLLSQFLSDRGRRFTSLNVGSQGGADRPEKGGGAPIWVPLAGSSHG